MPRSASRDRSDPFAWRRRYFHRPTRLAVCKFVSTAIAVFAAAVWAIYDVAADPANPIAHTHGSLVGPHAAWEHDCAACHQSFGTSDFTDDPLTVLNARSRWQKLTCVKCHTGPAHQSNTNINAAGTAVHERCNNCHRDHDGRMNSLTHLKDSDCARCHSDLNRFASTANPAHPPITNFAKDHPAFPSLANFNPDTDRKLKFSHSLHMTVGIVYLKGAKNPTTLAGLPDEAKLNYKKFEQPNGMLELKCEACHSLDSEIVGKDEQPATTQLRSKGDYYQPVNFEQHCRSCHPIEAPATVSNGLKFDRIAVPHRLRSAETKDYLSGRYAKLLAAEKPFTSALPFLPGGRTDPAPEWASVAKSFRDEVAKISDEGFVKLFHGEGKGCMKCHISNDEKIAPIPNRSIWLTKAKFDHTSHRLATCASCHPGTASAVDAGGKTEWSEKESVQILGLDSCRICHSPGTTRVEKPDGSTFHAGGIRSNCTDCHTYHNGANPHQGRGAKARDPDHPRALEEFFRPK